MLFTICSTSIKSAAVTHYDVLGIPGDASREVIKRAYHDLALRYHPDKLQHGDPAVTRRFELVNEAYSVLADPTSRKQYDRTLSGSSVRNVLLVACTLKELAGFKPLPVHAALAAAGLPLTLALRIGVPHWLLLPPGSREGDLLRMRTSSGIEFDVQLQALYDRRYVRSQDDLHATLWLPSWHNKRRPAVHWRTLCGKRIVLRPRGQLVCHGDICTARGYGMPRSGSHRPVARRGDLVVRLQLRSLRSSLSRAVLQACSIGAAAALARR